MSRSWTMGRKSFFNYFQASSTQYGLALFYIANSRQHLTIVKYVCNTVLEPLPWSHSVIPNLLNYPGHCDKITFVKAVHIGALCQFPFRWIYHRHGSKSTRTETGKTHLCAVSYYWGCDFSYFHGQNKYKSVLKVC